MLTHQGCRKHSGTSMRRAIVLLSALCLVFILVMASCMSAATTAQPAVAATAQPAVAATTAPTEGGTSRIRFGAWLSQEEKAVIDEQVKAFKDATGIDVELEMYGSYSDFVNVLAAQAAAGDLPDVIGGWRGMFDQLMLQKSVLDLKEIPDSFMYSAQQAARADGVIFALPWAAYKCLPDYRLLAISNTSKDESAARKLIDFLTGREPQITNFKSLQSWYPTLSDINKEYAGCADSGTFVKQPTGAQLQQIPSLISSDISALQDRLKGSTYWATDQPTTFNVDWSTAVGFDDNDGKYIVQVAAVPVRSEVETFFQTANIKEYITKGNTRITIGALQVNDDSVLDYRIPKGKYAVVWEWVDGSVANDRFVVVDEYGKEVYQGRFEDLNGPAITKTGAITSEILQPFVLVEQGSWLLDWLFDNRFGRIP